MREAVEYREEEGIGYITGYGAVFDTTTDLGMFTEEIRAGAFDNVLVGQDVVFVFQHNTDNILARSKSGTLTYGVDSKGLWYRASMPDTTLGNDLKELLKRGDIMANSFAFSQVTDMTEKRNGKLHRTIIKIGRLHDISLVTHAAYEQAVVVTRSLPAPIGCAPCRQALLRRLSY
jgi:HK97 family phage prohead protease